MIQKTILPAKGKTQLIVIALEMKKKLVPFWAPNRADVDTNTKK